MSRRIFFNGLFSKVPFRHATLRQTRYSYDDFNKVIPVVRGNRQWHFGVTLSFQKPCPVTPPKWDLLGPLDREITVSLGPVRKVEPFHPIPSLLEHHFGIQKAQVDIHDHGKLGEFFRGTGLFVGTRTFRYVGPVSLGAECFEGRIGAICDSGTSPCMHLVQSIDYAWFPGHPLGPGMLVPGDEIYRNFKMLALPTEFAHFDHYRKA